MERAQAEPLIQMLRLLQSVTACWCHMAFIGEAGAVAFNSWWTAYINYSYQKVTREKKTKKRKKEYHRFKRKGTDRMWLARKMWFSQAERLWRVREPHLQKKTAECHSAHEKNPNVLSRYKVDTVEVSAHGNISIHLELCSWATVQYSPSSELCFGLQKRSTMITS